MADLISGLVALFVADTAVVAIAGERVFGGELPEDETASMPRGALVLRPSGGASLTGGSYAEFDTQRIDLRSYGVTPSEAAALDDAAATMLRRLKRATSAGVLIHSANSAGGFWTGRDPDTGWPMAWRSFQILHSFKEV